MDYEKSGKTKKKPTKNLNSFINVKSETNQKCKSREQKVMNFL